MTATPDVVMLEQFTERLRQERETFDQKKRQDQLWFILRFAMGGVAAFLLPAIMVLCSWILVNHAAFDSSTVTLAGSALLIDAMGLVLSIWKIVLGKPPESLAPVTGPVPVLTHQKDGLPDVGQF